MAKLRVFLQAIFLPVLLVITYLSFSLQSLDYSLLVYPGAKVDSSQSQELSGLLYGYASAGGRTRLKKSGIEASRLVCFALDHSMKHCSPGDSVYFKKVDLQSLLELNPRMGFYPRNSGHPGYFSLNSYPVEQLSGEVDEGFADRLIRKVLTNQVRVFLIQSNDLESIQTVIKIPGGMELKPGHPSNWRGDRFLNRERYLQMFFVFVLGVLISGKFFLLLPFLLFQGTVLYQCLFITGFLLLAYEGKKSFLNNYSEEEREFSSFRVHQYLFSGFLIPLTFLAVFQQEPGFRNSLAWYPVFYLLLVVPSLMGIIPQGKTGKSFAKTRLQAAILSFALVLTCFYGPLTPIGKFLPSCFSGSFLLWFTIFFLVICLVCLKPCFLFLVTGLALTYSGCVFFALNPGWNYYSGFLTYLVLHGVLLLISLPGFCYYRFIRGREQVLHLGYFGFGNLGDDLLLMAARDRFSSAPQKHLSGPLGQVAHSLLRNRHLEILSNLLRTKTLSLGPGGILQDRTSLASLHYYLFFALLARFLGARVVFTGQGLSPLGYRISSWSIWFTCLFVDSIEVRDQESLETFLSQGVHPKKLVISRDLVYELPLAGGGDYSRPVDEVHICLRSWKDLPLEDIVFFSQTCGKKVSYFLFQRDDTLRERLLELEPRARIFVYREDPLAFARHFIKAQYILSMRYHGVLLALLAKRKIFVLSYDRKCENLARSAPRVSLVPESGWQDKKALRKKLRSWLLS